MSTNDWANDPEFAKWAEDVIIGMAPKMAESAFVVSLVSPGKGDVKFWVELGASIMMNKPILAVVLKGAEVPPKLRLVADEIVYMPNGVDAASSPAFIAACERMAKRYDDPEGGSDD